MVPKGGKNEGSGIREKGVFGLKGKTSEIKMYLCSLNITKFLMGEPVHKINDLTQTS